MSREPPHAALFFEPASTRRQKKLTKNTRKSLKCKTKRRKKEKGKETYTYRKDQRIPTPRFSPSPRSLASKPRGWRDPQAEPLPHSLRFAMRDVHGQSVASHAGGSTADAKLVRTIAPAFATSSRTVVRCSPLSTEASSSTTSVRRCRPRGPLCCRAPGGAALWRGAWHARPGTLLQYRRRSGDVREIQAARRPSSWRRVPPALSADGAWRIRAT